MASLLLKATGTVWSDASGDKVIVLGHDGVTDQFFVYNYREKKTFFVAHKDVDDQKRLVEPWERTVAFEKGLAEGARGDIVSKLRTAFVENVQNEIGQAGAAHVIEEKAGLDLSVLPDRRHFVYSEYVLVHKIRKVTRITLVQAVEDMLSTIRYDIQHNKVSKIVWRIEPEYDLWVDEITGNRFFKLYARFVAFSDGVMVDGDAFLGARKNLSLDADGRLI